MKEKLISMLIGMAVKRMDSDTFKRFADMALDFVEDYVSKTQTPYDDAVLLPLCATIRVAFGVEDNDEVYGGL